MTVTMDFLASSPFFAYLDPGTGSIILQSVIAGIFGAMIAIKVFWRRIVNFFKGNSGEEVEAASAEQTNDE